MSSKVKLEIIESDSNYVATIVKLPELRKVDWLDNLMVANVFGYNCLVSKDSNPDSLYVFFPAESVLSEKFLSWNNLYRKSELNCEKDKKWFFDESGRVKAVKFKWVVSSGLLIPVSSLQIIGKYLELKEGESFHIMDWEKVCWKYRRPVAPEKLTKSQRISKRLEKFDIVIPNQFRFHVDTPQFLRFIQDFKEWDRVVITEKLHWTSAVFSNVLVKKKLWIIDRIAKIFWASVNDTEYRHLYSSRTVIKNDDIDDERNKWGGYYWEDLWWIYAKQLESKIEKGITLYGEIVGYKPSWAYIQKGYHYGCKEWESKFYVYRMTYTTPDGIVVEFTDSQIRQYCSLRSLAVVPLLQSMTYYNDDEFLNDTWLLDNIEVMCPLNDNKVPREWVVIRRDGQETYSAYKLKSQLFLTWETKQLDEGWEDLESNS